MGILNFLTSKMLGESEPESKYGFIYGLDMHGVDLNEGIEKGIVEPLMEARRKGKRFCVDFGSTVPVYKWDKYGDGTWNPPRHYIMILLLLIMILNKKRKIFMIFLEEKS